MCGTSHREAASQPLPPLPESENLNYNQNLGTEHTDICIPLLLSILGISISHIQSVSLNVNI